MKIELVTISLAPERELTVANLTTLKRECNWDSFNYYTKEKWIKAFEKEHSTLRACWFLILLYDVPRSIAAQLRTHSAYGTYSWMSSSRPDLTKENREENEAKGKYIIIMINPLGWIDLCAKRLCTRAEESTRKLVNDIIKEMKDTEDEFFEALAEISKPECAYKNKCAYGKDCFGHLKAFHDKIVEERS